MARLVLPSVSYKWLKIEIMNSWWYGRGTCSRTVRIHGVDRISRLCNCKISALLTGRDKDSRDFRNRKTGKVRRTIVSSHVDMSNNFDKRDVLCRTNALSMAEGVRSLTTNVTVNLSHQIVNVADKVVHNPDQNELQRNTGELQNGFAGLVMSETVEDSEPEKNVLATFEVTVAGTVETERQADEGKWWHFPDSIAEILPLPADFAERLEVLFGSFGSRINSRELLLRVLVHKSYYDQKIPASMKDREYRKPQAPSFIDSGKVEQECVEGLSWKTISCMTFGEAHGEVRSQLAILGDAVIGLSVSSLLVQQHSSAGTITERKCQLVSNTNLARVWRTLLGPQEFVLSFGDTSSQSAVTSRMMADSCEAYIGALYTEKGFQTAYTCVNNTLLPLLVQADSIRNPVHSLNVQSSTSFQVLPEYRLIGIDNKNTHRQVCRVRVYVKGYRMATGMGINQKLARLDAARKALQKWSTVFIVV